MSLTTDRNDPKLKEGQKKETRQHEIKLCSTCAVPIIQTKSKRKRYRCKDCSRIQQNRLYKEGGEEYKHKKIAYNERRRQENMVFLLNYLTSNGCIECGEKDPIVLEFDHVGTKKANISAVGTWGKEKLIKEIELCEVRCANCHARKTAKQLNYYSYASFNKPHFW